MSALRRVLLLGSGYTSGPLVECLTRAGTVSVTVASDILEQAKEVAAPFQNTTSAEVDVTSDSSLSSLITGHDLVISYVPFKFHPLVARQCIAHKVNMLTASYVSPELEELDEPAKQAGITLFNETGLDPGIDHMLAMQCIDEVHDKGGKILSFELMCGGLPAPECADNPLKYKFSWSPKSVLLGTMHPAVFLKNGELVKIPEGGDILDIAEEVSLFPDLPPLESYPNRDSTKYKKLYNIPEASTIIRSTLRYSGFCSILHGLLKLGLLKDVEHQRLQPDAAPLRWRDLMAILISQSDIRTPDLRSSVLKAVDGDQEKLASIEQLGLLSDDPVPLRGTPIDTLCDHLLKQMQYRDGERDAVFLREMFTIEWPDKTKERRYIDLIEYGKPHGHTAMAVCVGLPTAIAAHLILDGKVKERGIVLPTIPSIYNPILHTLREEGIQAKIMSEQVD